MTVSQSNQPLNPEILSFVKPGFLASMRADTIEAMRGTPNKTKMMSQNQIIVPSSQNSFLTI